MDLGVEAQVRSKARLLITKLSWYEFLYMEWINKKVLPYIAQGIIF